MDQSFGTRLRLQRERQRVAITTIAAETKINPSLLQGLEHDDLSHWPDGIFRRAYVRAYARAIGLDPDAVVREVLALYPDSVEVLPAGSVVWPEPHHESENVQSATRLGRMVASAMAAAPAILRRPRKSEPVVDDAPAVARNEPPERARVRPEPNRRSGTSHERPIGGEAVSPELSLSAVAHLCTRLARVLEIREVAPLLADVARSLDAVGLIVWSCDPDASALRPSLAHGYSEAVLARLASVSTDAGNAVAVAFRTADVCVVDSDGVTGAVVVPLIGPGGCVGVLALELPDGGERRESVRAFAAILAAQLVTLFGSAPLAIGVSA